MDANLNSTNAIVLTKKPQNNETVRLLYDLACHQVMW